MSTDELLPADDQDHRLIDAFLRANPEVLISRLETLNHEERKQLASCLQQAEHRSYCKLIFNDPDPNLRERKQRVQELNQWLREHAGRKMESEVTRFWANAVRHARDILKVHFYYADPYGVLLKVQLDLNESQNGNMRVRLKEPGRHGRLVLSRVSFPSIEAK